MTVGTIVVICSWGELLEMSFMALGCKQVGIHHRSLKLSLKLLLHKSWPGFSPQAHLELQDSTSQITPLGPLHQGRWDISRTAESCILTEVHTDLSVTMRVQKGSLADLPWRLEVAPKVDHSVYSALLPDTPRTTSKTGTLPSTWCPKQGEKKTGDFLFGESHQLCRRLEEHSTYGERKKRFGAKEYSAGMGRYWPTKGHHWTEKWSMQRGLCANAECTRRNTHMKQELCQRTY